MFSMSNSCWFLLEREAFDSASCGKNCRTLSRTERSVICQCFGAFYYENIRSVGGSIGAGVGLPVIWLICSVAEDPTVLRVLSPA